MSCSAAARVLLGFLNDSSAFGGTAVVDNRGINIFMSERGGATVALLG